MTFKEFLKVKKNIVLDANGEDRDLDELMDEYYDEYTDFLNNLKEGCDPE
jgi:hypothetical protein